MRKLLRVEPVPPARGPTPRLSGTVTHTSPDADLPQARRTPTPPPVPGPSRKGKAPMRALSPLSDLSSLPGTPSPAPECSLRRMDTDVRFLLVPDIPC